MLRADSKHPAALGILRLLTVLMLAGQLLALSGCGSLVVKDPASPYYKVPRGSLIVLHQSVEIPRGYTRVWIQQGVVVGTSFSAYASSCGLEVAHMDGERSRIVSPGVFRVTRTQFLREEVVQANSLVRLASNGPTPIPEDMGFDSGSGPLYHEGYHLWVESAEQPEVRRFTCRGAYDLPESAKPPSIAEIRAALGTVATLELPEEPSVDKEKGGA